MKDTHLEIERKFLIAYPDIAFLESLKDCTKADIVQIYTKDRVRIRKWEENGNIRYIKTVKKKVSELVRIETESDITEEEFLRLKKLADPDRRPIIKTRYSYPYGGKLIEIDVFDFWQDRAFCEVELEYEDEEFTLPPFINVIKEVTGDKRYRNSALAASIPYDKI